MRTSLFEVKAIIKMIRAFFRRNPSNPGQKSCVTPASDEIELEEFLSVLKRLSEAHHPDSQKTGSSLKIPPSPQSLAIPPAIVPTSLEQEVLNTYTQLLIQNSTSVNRRRHQKLRHLDKVLFISSCIYLIGVVGWLLNQGLTLSIQSDRAMVQAEHQEAKAQLDKGEEASPKTELLPPPSEPAQTSQLETAPTDATQSTKQRVSVPVSPVRQIPKLEVASAPTPMPAPPPPQPLPTAIPPKAPAPILSPAPEAPSPTATDSQTEAPPPEAPSTATAPPKSSPVLSSKAAVPPLINSRLVGILQLGDRSVALFALNDVTQRVKVGDRIGTSGWTLGAITDQTAEIYRDQEKRSLYVGEGF